MHVSPGAADLLTSLRENLLFMMEYISPLISPSILERLIPGLDELILSEVSII